MNAPVHVARSPRRTQNWLDLLWQPLVWSVPFALFFGTLWGGNWPAYWTAYKISMVFSYTIRWSTVAVERLLLPRLRLTAPAGRYPWWREGGLFAIVSVTASLVSAVLVDRFVYPGFLQGSRAWQSTAAFSLVFTLLVGGIIYARVFYRISVERALQVERMRAELARAELRSLRSQVHPHFLFNTLNTIAALIAEDPRAAEDIVTRLADVFRYSLTTASGDHARFGDEMEFLRAYLAIEHARLGSRLHFDESIEPGLETVPVPGLLFQPLVENAVRYAVAEREAGGSVRLEARRDGDSLRVTVSDDGPGFVPGTPARGHGVGLESVRERLRLAGSGHSLEIDSRPGHGARVTVTLPLRPELPPPSSFPTSQEPSPCD
jgi:signal transduction histidine kinase